MNVVRTSKVLMLKILCQINHKIQMGTYDNYLKYKILLPNIGIYIVTNCCIMFITYLTGILTPTYCFGNLCSHFVCVLLSLSFVFDR